MTPDLLYCVIIPDEAGAGGGGAEFLSAFNYSLSSWKDEESGALRHTIYFQTREEAETAIAFLKKSIPEWNSFGLRFSDPEYAELKKENWAESWKIHFKPMEISSRLLIRPTWEKTVPRPGQKVMVLDPGMSFGTGQHATTKFCLSAIDDFLNESGGRPLTLLDAGSGSGILAIAGWLLGCRGIDAFDIDPETVPIARENAAMNHLPSDAISFSVSSLEDFPSGKQYDIVAANILSSALIAGCEKLLSLVKPDGKLILAGILDAEYPRVKKVFEDASCREIRSRAEKEWRGGAFVLQSSKSVL